MSRLIDLTKPIISEDIREHELLQIKIKHKAHRESEGELNFVGLPKAYYPEGFVGWANDEIEKLGVHSVTHIDAPWHYGEMTDGKKAMTIDEIPLEWCYGDGVVIDMTHKKDGEVISKQDVKEELEKIGVQLSKGMIVLIHTGRDKIMYTKEYLFRGTGVSREATEWLIDQGIKVMGIDQWGWDLPLPQQAAEAKAGKTPNPFWEAHRVGCKKAYCHIEQIVGLDQLPSSGFKVMAMPLPLKGCSASPIRLVAIIED
nr:cyclase family protein [uncultured Cellulosilyticum sp.]